MSAHDLELTIFRTDGDRSIEASVGHVVGHLLERVSVDLLPRLERAISQAIQGNENGLHRGPSTPLGMNGGGGGRWFASTSEPVGLVERRLRLFTQRSAPHFLDDVLHVLLPLLGHLNLPSAATSGRGHQRALSKPDASDLNKPLSRGLWTKRWPFFPQLKDEDWRLPPQNALLKSTAPWLMSPPSSS